MSSSRHASSTPVSTPAPAAAASAVSAQFANLGLAEPLLRSLATEGYSVATPVQAKAIPFALEGRDVLGCAQTGTGKTAAFALPILHRLSKSQRADSKSHSVRCLVLSPTRELATQIADGFRTYGRHLAPRVGVVFGGVSQVPQVKLLRHGCDIIVATPGRLLDLMNQGHVDFRSIEVLVLDEADRMLDMGFIHDIRKITAKLPAKRQTMFFSATMPSEIRQLADSLLSNPAVVQVAPVATTAEGIDESVYFVEKGNKPQLLAHLVHELPMSRAIVFTRTKHGADKVVRHLHSRGIKSEAIHGNKSQNARQRALENFRANRIPVLVATDIASRGIDIDDVSHVVNYDLTHEPEVYVHRIGRTARAGAKGAAVSFCDRDEKSNLRGIERLIRRQIPVRTDHPTYETRPNPQIHEGHDAEQSDRGARRDDRGERRNDRGDRGGDRGERSAHATAQPIRTPYAGGTRDQQQRQNQARQQQQQPRGGAQNRPTGGGQARHGNGQPRQGGGQAPRQGNGQPRQGGFGQGRPQGGPGGNTNRGPARSKQAGRRGGY
jgi:ATP-dependent RNA helicase RhlE